VIRAAFALLVLGVLAGCATQAPVSMPTTPPDPAALQRWTASGRLALSAGEQGGSGSFVWNQDGRTSRLDLRGPLGAGALQVRVVPGGISLVDGSGREVDTEAARNELRARLGADLPWDDLSYWMLGVPAPGSAATVANAEAGTGRVIEQAGWRIDYDAYTPANGTVLPRRFTATREGVRVKVVVDSWALPAAGSGP
jgi:outer membrane lipoprotein LolB